MAISLVQLANDALATLGEQPIVNLDKNNATSTAILLRTKIPLVQRSILMEADWNCARRIAKLVKIANASKRGYEYTYQLPTDPECLRIVQISVGDGKPFIDMNAYYNHNNGMPISLWDRDNNVLLCDSDTVWIKYTALISPSEFDPMLASAFSAQLAAELAYAIPASASLGEFLTQIAKRKLSKAKSRNALDRNILMPEGDVIAARYYNADKHVRVDMSEEMEENG